MNPITKRIIQLGVLVTAVSLCIFFATYTSPTPVSWLCMGFIVFAIFQLFGTMALIFQFALDKISRLVRIGIGVISGIYCACAVITSLAFMPYTQEYITMLLLFQVGFFVFLVFMQFFIVIIARAFGKLKAGN